MAKKSLVVRASPTKVELDPSVVDTGLDAPTPEETGLKSRITRLPNGKLRIETFDPTNEAIHVAETEIPQVNGQTGFILQSNPVDEAKSVVDRSNTPSKGSLMAPPSGSIPTTGSTEVAPAQTVINGDPLEGSGKLTGSGKAPLMIEDAASKAKFMGDAPRASSDLHPDIASADDLDPEAVVKHLAETGAPHLALQLLKYLAPKAIDAPIGLAASLLSPSSIRPDPEDPSQTPLGFPAKGGSDPVADQTVAAFSPGSVQPAKAEDVSAAPLSDEAPVTARKADDVTDRPLASDGSPTPSAKTSSPAKSASSSGEGPMTDEEIHQWNLKHNKNYDPSIFDVASGSFNYNKGNQ